MVCDSGLRYIIKPGVVVTDDTCISPWEVHQDSLVITACGTFTWKYKDLTYDGFDYTDQNLRDDWHPMHGLDSTGWPITEDSIRTTDFAVQLGDTIRVERLVVWPDSAWFATALSDTSQFIKFELLFKDSSSGVQIGDAIESIVFKNRPEEDFIEVNPCIPKDMPPPMPGRPGGPGRIISHAVASVPPSGKGYLTLRISKSQQADLELSQTVLFADGLDFGLEDGGPQGSYKTAARETTPQLRSLQTLFLEVLPNPVRATADVRLTSTPGSPVRIDLFNVSGQHVITLADVVSPSSGVFNTTLAVEHLASGTYFVRAESLGKVVTARVTVVK